MAASFAPKVLGLVALALIGTIMMALARAESVTLTRKSSNPADRGAAAGVDELAGLSLQTLHPSPAAAAALHLAVDAVTPPSDRPLPSGRRAPETPGDVSPKPTEAEAAKLAAVPEPTAMVLGLTSTLILGSLSWKRRLAHPSRA